MFEQRTTGEVESWLDGLEVQLFTKEVPVLLLLERLEAQKMDEYETPNVKAVRMVDDTLKTFRADRLIAVLRGLQTVLGSSWIEVDDQTYDVLLHDKPNRILEQFTKHMRSGDGDVP